MKIYSCMPNNDTVDFWIKNNLNVLFYGKHGVGKSSIIKEGFERNKLKYFYFSAATMDPWVDFIGVPKEIEDEKGSYLELIRPKSFRDDEVEALFFDEFNRSHKKVRNAVMELIQFKSINGKKFPNLKMVWAAVNPENEDDIKYDVDKIDPAQEDRFHIHIEIPYRPYSQYFREKYGRQIAESAIDWWNELPENTKIEVSPRRLEYAIQLYNIGGNLLHILPPYTNVDKLVYSLKNGSPLKEYKNLLLAGNEKDIKEWLSIENNYSAVKQEILKKPELVLHLLPDEKICSLVAISSKIMDYVFSNTNKFLPIIRELSENSQNTKISKKASDIINGNKNIAKINNIEEAKIPLAVKKAALQIKNYHWNTYPNINYKKNARNMYKLDKSLPEIAHSVSVCGNQTPERIRICNSVIKVIQNSRIISKSEAETALKIIEWVVSKTQRASIIYKTENLIQTINKCVLAINNLDNSNNDCISISKFIDTYPNISGKLIAKSFNNEINEWFMIP